MANDEFFQVFFDGFWENVDRSGLRVDDDSMFADSTAFDWIIEAVRPSVIIEVGSWKGHSANYMADLCKHKKLLTKIVCVDSFLGGPEHWILPWALEKLYRVNGMPTIINRFLANTISRGNDDIVFPLTLDSLSASHVLRHFQFQADIIFIDAGHVYSAVCADIMQYMPLLSARGVMWGDDYQAKDVANAVHDCAKEIGVPVVVFPGTRKWIYLTNDLLASGLPKGIDLRSSYEGWQHP